MKPVHISFDFGATITRAPELFARWAHNIINGGGKVTMVTGVAFDDEGNVMALESEPRLKWLKDFDLEGKVEIRWCDNGTHSRRKVEVCKDIGADMHVDNSWGECFKMNRAGVLALGVGTMMWKHKQELDELKANP